MRWQPQDLKSARAQAIYVLAPGNEAIWRSKMAHTSLLMVQAACHLADTGAQYGAAPGIIMEATGLSLSPEIR